VLLAWLCLRCYDIPVREWLTRRFMKKTDARSLSEIVG